MKTIFNNQENLYQCPRAASMTGGRRLRSGRRTSLSTLRPYRKLFLLSYLILHCQRIDISLRLFKSLTSPFWRISEKLCIPIGDNISSAISSNSANIQILTDFRFATAKHAFRSLDAVLSGRSEVVRIFSTYYNCCTTLFCT